MGWSVLNTALAHHGEAADPTLLKWIKDVLDHLLGLGPWAVIIVLGLIIVLLPVGLVTFYLWQLRNDDSGGVLR
jgi:hypothetical protein